MYFNNNYYQHLLNQYQYLFQAGDIIAGTIFSKEITGYLVNIGAKYAAYLPTQETQPDQDNNFNNSLVAKTTCEFFIFVKNKKSQQCILSLKRLVYIKSWQRIKQLQYENTIINTYIYGTNKGGILVNIENIRGFIPKSHIGYTKKNIESSNENIYCKFLLINEYKNQIIVSHKCALLEKHINNIKIGYIIKAPITEIKPYGILVNIYNLPALLHISEISKGKINNLYQLFKIGETILVKVIHINTKQGKLLVSCLHLV